MLAALKRRWTDLKRGTPGRRFQDRYRRAAEARARGGLSRILRVSAAAVAIVIGVVLVFLPGPAVVFFFIAGALLASESLHVARALDWTELKLRAVWSWWKRRRPGAARRGRGRHGRL